MTTDEVWITTAMSENELFLLDCDGQLPAGRAIRQGKKPLPEDLPIVLFPMYKKTVIDELPAFFVDGGHSVFSKDIACVLRSFDLGETYMLPVQIVLADRETEVFAERGYVTINRYALLENLEIEACRNLRPPILQSELPGEWRLPIELRDDDIAISTANLNVPPIWAERSLQGATFFRGDLVTALKAAGVHHYWDFKACRLL